MNRQPCQRPRRWWSPKPSAFWVRFWRRARRRIQTQKHYLAELEVFGLNHVRQALAGLAEGVGRRDGGYGSQAAEDTPRQRRRAVLHFISVRTLLDGHDGTPSHASLCTAARLPRLAWACFQETTCNPASLATAFFQNPLGAAHPFAARTLRSCPESLPSPSGRGGGGEGIVNFR